MRVVGGERTGRVVQLQVILVNVRHGGFVKDHRHQVGGAFDFGLTFKSKTDRYFLIDGLKFMKMNCKRFNSATEFAFFLFYDEVHTFNDRCLGYHDNNTPHL